MAKGNMLLGYSRGSVGDVTFYRSGGSQRSRARNRNPNNPKTEKQQTQRSRFANAVKFYKQATTNFFRFAYEDKKVNESDYNAFMRHNTLRSGFIGMAASKIANWPAFGAWEVTSGSLPTIERNMSASGSYTFDLGDADPDDERGNATTIGQISTHLINNSGGIWRSGDIITIFGYDVKPIAGLPTVDTVNNSPVAASGYLQFTLDTSDTRRYDSLSSPLFNGVTLKIISFDSDGFTVGFNGVGQTDFTQLAIIHSRNTADGLLVSTQEMVALSETLVDAALAESGTYFNSVIADWDASANAILQGEN